MKNRRWITLGMCGLMTWFFVMPAVADNVDSPAGASMTLQIERKTITRDSADIYRTNNKTISLGVYIVFSKEWDTRIKDADVSFLNSQIAWAFYADESFCSTGGVQTASQLNSLDRDHYLPNPSDYVSICAYESSTNIKPTDGCTVPKIIPNTWYAQSLTWDNWGWPTYAWGGAFVSLNPIDVSNDKYLEKQQDGSYKIKIFDIQFRLNPINANYRDLPVGFVDDIEGSKKIDASTSNCQINPSKGNDRYWPAGQTTCPGSTLCQDWTDLKNTEYFSFIPGGLFIETGPEVVTFEPYFGILSFSNRLITNNLY